MLLVSVRICVLVRKARRQHLPVDGLMSLRPSPVPTGRLAPPRRVFDKSQDLFGAGLWWICLNPVFVRLRWIHLDSAVHRLCLCVYMFDHFNLFFSLSVLAVVLIRWSYETLI